MKTNRIIQTNNNERTLVSGKKIKVLLVMTDKEASDNLRSKLSDCCELSLIDNTVLCNSAFVDDDTDVIVIDEIVGGKYGSELCFRLKSDEQLVDIPVILLISAFESENFNLFRQCGANRLLTKDFNSEILNADIQMLVENSSIYRKKIKELKMKTIPTTIPEETLNVKRNRELMEKVYKLLDEFPLSETYEVGQLCKDVNMSQSSFYNRIKKITGNSPKYLIDEHKINKACELMHSQKYDILEIVVMLGYCDNKYFRKKFKQYRHICPKQYMKNLKNSNDTHEEEEEN